MLANMGKKKRSTEAVKSVLNRFLDEKVIQNGVIANLKKSINLTDVTKRFTDDKVAQQASMIGNFNLGKKKRSTKVVESLPKRFLDGKVVQQSTTISNSIRKKRKMIWVEDCCLSDCVCEHE